MKSIFGIFCFTVLSGFLSPAFATIPEEIKWSLNCTRPTAEYDVKVNNVRLTIRNAGGIKTNSYYFSNFSFFDNKTVPIIATNNNIEAYSNGTIYSFNKTLPNVFID